MIYYHGLFFITGQECAVYFSWVERTISQGHILEKPPSVAVDDHGKCEPLPCRLARQLLVPSSRHITDHALGVPCVCVFPGDSGSRCGFASEQPLILCDDRLPGHGRGESGPGAAVSLLGDVRLAMHLSKASATQCNGRARGSVAMAPSFSRTLRQAGVFSWSTVT